MAGITGDLTNAIQLKFTGGNGSSTRIYVDNIYFWKGQPVGIEELAVTELRVYPNPTTDVWKVKSDQRIDVVEVLDIQGKVVYSAAVNAKNATIDAAGFENGIYFMRLTSANETKSMKLIKN